MLKLETLLPRAKKFLSKTRLISINKAAIPRLARDLRRPHDLPAMADFKNQPLPFYLLVDGLNFCFWHPNPKKKFSYGNHSGSVALGYLIKKFLEENIRGETFSYSLIRANKRIRSEGILVTMLTGARGELQLPMERIRIIQEIGKFLEKFSRNITNSRHGEIMREIIGRFENKDVNLLADFLARHLPYTFGDVSIKHGVKLPFYKKLRLLISDLHALAGIKFKNLDKLLVYADYKLPQVLIHYGILKPNQNLLSKIKKRALLMHNSEEEIALRAGTVAAAEVLKKATKLSYSELDFRLWLLSRKLSKTSPPYHLTLNRFY